VKKQPNPTEVVVKAALVLMLIQACITPASGAQIVVQVDSLSPEVVSYVAKMGQPRTVSAPPNTDLLKLISSYCGSANARRSYLALFLAANADNADIRQKQYVTTQAADLGLPACTYAQEAPTTVTTTNAGPQWQNPEVWPPSQAAGKLKIPDHSIDFDLLAEYTSNPKLTANLSKLGEGSIPPVDANRLSDPFLLNEFNSIVQTVLENVNSSVSDPAKIKARKELKAELKAYETALRTQDIAAANDIPDFTRIPNGTPITTSDFVPGKYVFAAREGLDASQVSRDFPSSAKGAGPGGHVLSDFQPYFAVPQSNVAVSSCADPGGRPWPIDKIELQKVLDLRRKIQKPPTAGRMLVLDTGFPTSGIGVTPFLADYFIRKTASALDPDEEEHLWTATLPPQYFFDGLENANHGVAVLTLALGGVDVINSPAVIGNLLNQDGFLIAIMGYQLRDKALYLDDSAVANTLAGTNWGRIEVNVVNMSLRFLADSSGNLHNYVTNQARTLFVFAAGNDDPKGNDLADAEILPARWGGKSSPRVITVGSVDANNVYSEFANFGEDFVDLAAPGCKVPVLIWDSQTKKFIQSSMSGTSIAAPLVSFGANLLVGDYRELGRLKARLLGTGQYVAGLVTKDASGQVRRSVSSQRVLDLPAALAVPFDIVRDIDGKKRYGSVEWSADGEQIYKTKKKRDEVRQLSAFNPNNSLVQAVYVSATDPTSITFPSVKLIKGELANLQFREAVERDGKLILGPAASLDVRHIDSLTLCQSNECYRWRP
jgi:hypothetical protein